MYSGGIHGEIHDGVAEGGPAERQRRCVGPRPRHHLHLAHTRHCKEQGVYSNRQSEAIFTNTQSTQSAGPVRFLKFCSISIILLASLVAGRKTQCSAGAE